VKDKKKRPLFLAAGASLTIEPLEKLRQIFQHMIE
jgi:hypothetical protein